MYDQSRKMWVVQNGVAAYWIADDRTVTPVEIELVTDVRIYFRVTGSAGVWTRGQYGFVARLNRRVAPRGAVYLRDGKGHVDWSTVSVREA